MNSESPDSSAQPKSLESLRRPVSYQTLSAVLEDAQFLAAHPHQTVGKWSYGRILQHLADSLNRSIDGFDFRAPFPIRIFVSTFLKKKFLTEAIPAGYNLPKKEEVKLPSQDIPVDEALENLKQAMGRFEREEPGAKHPVFGKLTPDEWTQLHLRHAELHMSFVKPS